MFAHSIRLAGALALGFAAAVLPVPADTLHYRESSGQKATAVDYGVTTSASGVEVLSSEAGGVERTLWVPGTGVVSWHKVDEAGGIDVTGTRTGDTIQVTGRLKGKPVSRSNHVDAAPWYQIFGPALADLLPAAAAGQEFWVVNPDDLSAHKMMVRRSGVESITVNGESVSVFKVHFSPAGALAPFWGADFWYRQSDAAWVYSRLPENGSVTVTEIDEPSR